MTGELKEAWQAGKTRSSQEWLWNVCPSVFRPPGSVCCSPIAVGRPTWDPIGEAALKITVFQFSMLKAWANCNTVYGSEEVVHPWLPDQDESKYWMRGFYYVVTKTNFSIGFTSLILHFPLPLKPCRPMADKDAYFRQCMRIKACILPASEGLLRVKCWLLAISHRTSISLALTLYLSLTRCQRDRSSNLCIH